MMRYKMMFLVLLSFPFMAIAQLPPQWSLRLDTTKLLSASVDSMVSARLSRKKKGMVTLDFANRDTAFNRTVLLMNEQRNTLLRKELSGNCSKACFSVQELLSVTEGEPFTFYITDLPSDPKKRMLVRVAPVPICKIDWIN